jgi:hypothetical protein
MTGAVKIHSADPPAAPEEHTGKRERMYATTRPYLSWETIIAASPGEVFSSTENLLMGDPYTGIKQG